MPESSSVFAVGLATPPPLAVPATVTVVFGASTSLFVAVIVTVPVEAGRDGHRGRAAGRDGQPLVGRERVLPAPAGRGRRHVHRHRRAGGARQGRGHRGRAAVLTDGRLRQRQAHRRRALVVRDRQRLRGRIGDPAAARRPRHRHRRVRRVHVVVRRRDRHRAGRGRAAGRDGQPLVGRERVLPNSLLSRTPQKLAATSTVTAALEAPDRVAVTVVEPPFSLMDAFDSARLTVGVPMDACRTVFVIVSVFAVGLATPPPLAVPATVTVVFFVVVRRRDRQPEAKTSTSIARVARDRHRAGRGRAAGRDGQPLVGRERVLPAPAGRGRRHVHRRAGPPLEAPDRVAVTVVEPPFSLMDAFDSARLTVGVPSSSSNSISSDDTDISCRARNTNRLIRLVH